MHPSQIATARKRFVFLFMRASRRDRRGVPHGPVPDRVLRLPRDGSAGVAAAPAGRPRWARESGPLLPRIASSSGSTGRRAAAPAKPASGRPRAQQAGVTRGPGSSPNLRNQSHCPQPLRRFPLRRRNHAQPHPRPASARHRKNLLQIKHLARIARCERDQDHPPAPFRIRTAARRIHARIWGTVACAADARATITRSTAGSPANSWRTASRKRRFTRFRTTEPPTFDDTVNPTRAATAGIPEPAVLPSAASRGRKLAASGPSTKPCPCARTSRNSARRSNRALLGNPSAPTGYFLCAETTSRLRPLARRRLSTLRPALVALRLRNPCSRLRRILLGWYVRFTTTASRAKKRSKKPRAVRGVKERARRSTMPAGERWHRAGYVLLPTWARLRAKGLNSNDLPAS